MAHLRCLYLIFGQSTRALLFSKKTLLFVAGGLMYAGVLAIVLSQVGDQQDNNDLYAHVTGIALWQALMPFTAMFFAITAVRDEIASRTIVYLFSGPVPRVSIWLGKFFAATVVSTVVVGFAYLVGYVIAVQLGDDAGYGASSETLAAARLPIVIGCPAYCAVGTVLALFFKRPMIAGAIFVIGWEELVGTTPNQAGVRSLTVVDSIRTLFFHGVPEATRYRRDVMQWRGAGEELAVPPAGDAIQTLLVLTAVSLVLALFVGARRDYDTAPKD